MQSVTIKKVELLEKVKENRGNHRAVFERAIIVFRKKVIDELEASLERAKKGERIARMHSLVQPMDMTQEYDQAIAMMEMSVDEEIELTHQEFACYVLDRWHWKSQFTASNRGYVEEYNRLTEYHSEGELPAQERYGSALDD